MSSGYQVNADTIDQKIGNPAKQFMHGRPT